MCKIFDKFFFVLDCSAPIWGSSTLWKVRNTLKRSYLKACISKIWWFWIFLLICTDRHSGKVRNTLKILNFPAQAPIPDTLKSQKYLKTLIFTGLDGIIMWWFRIFSAQVPIWSSQTLCKAIILSHVLSISPLVHFPLSSWSYIAFSEDLQTPQSSGKWVSASDPWFPWTPNIQVRRV